MVAIVISKDFYSGANLPSSSRAQKSTIALIAGQVQWMAKTAQSLPIKSYA